jgi:hypothetical protein
VRASGSDGRVRGGRALEHATGPNAPPRTLDPPCTHTPGPLHLARSLARCAPPARRCPPCRGFTPKLAERYAELQAAGAKLEVVFISSDRTQADMDTYFGEMPWKALKFTERATKAFLSEKYEIEGIPTLVLLKPDGSLVTTEGREAIFTPPAEWDEFEAKKKAREAADAVENAALMGTMPEVLEVPAVHPCPLAKQAENYGGRSWGCDVCREGKTGPGYHCEDCNFDACLRCANTLKP